MRNTTRTIVQQQDCNKLLEDKIQMSGMLIPFITNRHFSRTLVFCISFLLLIAQGLNAQNSTGLMENKPGRVFRGGAATSNITPKIGTSINGNMKDITVKQIHDETHVRCIVLDDGQTRLAILTADLCMIYREQLDEAKKRANAITGIPIENMMMSATHTHSGGTACSVFQSDPDKNYLKFLTERIADAVVRANNNLAPARIGWDIGNEPTLVFNRRWRMNPVEIKNPFWGIDQLSTTQVKDITDPGLPVISIQTPDGHPIALLANYSLHYVGGTGPAEVSADYFGMFADRMKQLLQTDSNKNPPFVTMLSNGTSGNINNVNNKGSRLSLPPYIRMQQVANIVAAEAYKVYQNIKYQDWISLSSVQKEITLGVRLPNKKEIERAKEITANTKSPIMDSREEIYARETMLLKDYPKQLPLILQAFRLGDLAITAIPCEVFVEIGLEIKEKSPFKPTFTTSLANGYNGYLPTPEHHKLGGYETWRARSSYLEVDASDKVTEMIFELLNKLKGMQP
jgi:neutral ceramidase